MDAELFSKGTKMICSRHNTCGGCPLHNVECCAQPYYHGTINPVPIVEQWLAERQPKPLPERLTSASSHAEIVNAINQLIDHLK